MNKTEVNKEILAIKDDVKNKRIAKYEVYYLLKCFSRYENLNFSKVFQAYYLNISY